MHRRLSGPASILKISNSNISRSVAESSILLPEDGPKPTQTEQHRDNLDAIITTSHGRSIQNSIRVGGKFKQTPIARPSSYALRPRGNSPRKAGKDGLIIPQELEFLIDPIPTFPKQREYATLISRPLILKIKGYSNALLSLDIQRPVKQLQVRGSMSSTSVENRHTTLVLSLKEKEMFCHQQNSMVRVHGERDLKVLLEMGQIPFLPEPMKIVIWNCRCLARRSFKTNFTHLCDQNKPDLVVLTETQASQKTTEFFFKPSPLIAIFWWNLWVLWVVLWCCGTLVSWISPTLAQISTI
ncbi:Oligoribonuclease [Bienertia sinuspersici]